LFQNNRYLTRGVNAEIPPVTQLLLWQLIDQRRAQTLDYLQVFDLTIENGKQIIMHTQEQPPHSQCVTFHTDEEVIAHIFVIDDGEHSTMMLAEEY
jgi:hypothetical protein